MTAIASTAVNSPRPTSAQLDQLAINCIRTLSIDAVQRAKSGHPGTPMALAPLVYTIWNRVLRFDPKDPIWPGRDRFVLSNGHASMLLWSILYLTGTRAVKAEYERLGTPAVTLDDISVGSGNSTARHPDILNIIGYRESRRPPARWVKGSLPASAWRSRENGSPAATTSPISTSSITTFTPSVTTAV
jgi:transketolase